MGILPIWPGCTKAKFQGDIVVTDIKTATVQPSETKKEDLPQSETQPNEKTKLETKTDKPLISENKINEKPKSELKVKKTLCQTKSQQTNQFPQRSQLKQ